MSQNINDSHDLLQEQSESIERFALFTIHGRLMSNVKRQIKSHGCQWNHLYHGWLCPVSKEKEIQKTFHAAKLDYNHKIVTFPKGIIYTNSINAGQTTRLEILEEEIYKAERQLLTDVYRYNPELRPEDFNEVPSTEEKTPFQTQIEHDFHERIQAISVIRKDIETTRKAISNINVDSKEKVLDHKAPLNIVEAIIKEHFTIESYRTLQYCSDSFWRWTGIQYVEVEIEEMRKIIYAFLQDAKELSEKGMLEDFNPTKHKVDQVIDALRATCYLKHHPSSGAHWLDGRTEPDAKYLISFQNGLLSIKDWLKNSETSLIPHTPVLLNVNSLTFKYDNSALLPMTWLEFLKAIWGDDQQSKDTLQEWFGYTLTQNTRLHKILLLIGPPRSGKGTIGRVHRELLGHFNVAGPTLSSLAGEFGLQPLLNQMLALISDARLTGKGSNNIIIERLLSISGEDPLIINRKFLPPITVQLPTRITIMSNELPDMKDPSGAIAKRYLVLTLKKSWLGKEDILLFDRLKEELPGITLWALQGLKRLEQRGFFLQPKSSLETINELETMTSPIMAFVLERCIMESSVKVSVQILFDQWRDWCKETGYLNSGNIQSFGKNLKAAYPSIGVTRLQDENSRERYYVGIDLAMP